MREPSVAAGFARALMALAVQKGASQAALAESAQIELDELEDQDNRVPFAKYMALMRASQELSGDPALALHFGETFDMAELSIVGLIGQACETAAEAFAQLDRFNRLIIDVDVSDAAGRRLVLSRSGGQLWIVDTRKDPNGFPELTESSFARMVGAARRALGERTFIGAVHVTHKAPAYWAEYDRIFQMPVVFESDKNALLVTDDSFLTLKTPHPSRYVFGILSERAEALLLNLENAKTVRGQVECFLMPILHSGEAGMEAAARSLGLSRSTLFRLLRGEGTTFERVLDELRHKLALHYLSGEKLSVNEAAYLVGFSDPTAFSRAFKRWTGKSPRSVRASS